MVKIKMNSLAAGPDGVFPPGSIRIVSEAEAKELLDGGYAELLKKVDEKKPDVATKKESKEETATVGMPERATVPPPRRRGRPVKTDA